MLSIISAMDEQKVIGFRNQLPWSLPADLQYFKKVTWGKTIIMGRKTYDSIGHALPGRTNVVVTRDKTFTTKDAIVFYDLNSALQTLTCDSDEDEFLVEKKELMIIGGASLYSQTLKKADRLYITFIHAKFEGDTFFPEWNKKEWREISREDHKSDEKNKYDYSFVVFERKFKQETENSF